MTAPATEPLSATLRRATSAVHDDAENSAFMTALLEGTQPKEAYIDYLGQLLCVYRALEGAGERLAGTPVAAALIDERLLRVGFLAADLTYLYGTRAWRSELHPTDATLAYAEELDRVGRDGDQAAFAAHHYVRYLGDLAGGQAISRLVSRTYGFTGDGTRCLQFPGIDKIKPYRDQYRERLDGLEILQDNRDYVVEMAKKSFDFNSAIFRGLHARYPRP
ncbi:biliverdin-producing heme oxygenase [Corynebacterium sp. TAE3-ERU12]|uniref:biliverdin-producing heme oxygenase n=1 Tax=Corynebacterium sp. TAE3-ERU12 TaxID=2849491 RepID=UPI001C461DBA|nr:biliverdin-producing heme oxygenase [Corynebacterium sp. TAE3-ERU12]MBV7295749.1 biliverdin-producing heme oxygenase [Corynebacterium sp. TAE3-ERU12]